jgi:hypothetical protein
VGSERYLPSYEITKAWFALGETSHAVAWLEQAYEQRSHSLVFLFVDPQLGAIRESEAFVRFADRVRGG